MKVLGIWLDTHLTTGDQFRSLQKRAQSRQGILARVANSSWSLETTVLRVTYDALITSLLRYSLVPMGSWLPDDLMDKIDTQAVNTAARRVTGLPRITRIDALHFLAGTNSIRNMYILQCGATMRATLRCSGNGARDRLMKEICVVLRRSTLDLAIAPVEFQIEDNFTRYTSEVPVEILRTSRWMRNGYPEAWKTAYVAQIQNM